MGGNVLTGFSIKDLPIFEAALERSKDENLFIVRGDEVFNLAPCGLVNDPVLCKRRNKDASKFWRIFDEVRTEFASQTQKDT